MRLGKKHVRLLRSGVPRFLLLAGAASALHATVIFTFENDSGKATPFLDTVAGLTVNFTSSGAAFQVGNHPNFFTFSNGQILLGPAAVVTLSLNFNSDLSSVSMNFGTATANVFNLSAFENGTLIGMASQTGTVQISGGFPEGMIGFSGGTFNAIQLTTSAQGFAIDNLAAEPIPEANSFWLFLSGAAILFGCLRVGRAIGLSRLP